MNERFPGIGPDWARFDGPAGTQMVDVAIDAMGDFLRSGDNANGHGLFAASVASTELVDRSRAEVAELIGGDAEGIVFGANMTTLTFAFTRALARDWAAGDEIVGTRLDHDANVTPWKLAADDHDAVVQLAPFDVATGRLDPEAVTALIGPRTRWVAITGASNALGTMPDLAPVVVAAHAQGARVFVDGVHLVPHGPVDVRAMGCDAFVTSPYKWYGPHAGVLWLTEALRESVMPFKVRPASDRAPERFETGTLSFETIAAVGAAACFLSETGIDRVAADEAEVFAPLHAGLRSREQVIVHGPPDLAHRTPTVSFSMRDRHPDEIAAHLASRGVAVWSGNYYAVETMAALGLADVGAVRAGISAYTTTTDVDRLLAALDELAR
ncbi:MAG: cysteine desulfurase-like protein [Acidimicrobiia bacterium]